MNKGFRTGRKLSKEDVGRRLDAFNRKKEEYNNLSLEELKTLYPTLRGAYRYACEQIAMEKLNKEREILAETSSKELNEPKEETNKLELDGE